MKKYLNLKGKAGHIAGVALILSLILSSCGILSEPTLDTTPDASMPMSTASAPNGTSSEEELELTLDELAAFNGKNGQPAYIAVDGIIYDVSDLDLWAGGEHQGRFNAGQDLTKEIDEESPHGRSTLDRAKIVGRLVDP